MIYQFSRFISGPYLNKAVDFYISNQLIFNSIILIAGFCYIVKQKSKGKSTGGYKLFKK